MLLAETELAGVCSDLRGAGIEISALRLPALPDDAEAFLTQVRNCGITRLIVPLFGAAETGFIAAAKKAGIACLVVNHHTGAARAAEAYNDLGFAEPSFCFNPAEFAAAGENPFLTSYRVGRFIRKTAQLDVSDGLWDGSPALPGRGNGEVKELISIFRCRNFDGFLVLGGGMNGGSGLKFADHVAAFTRLLDRM